MYVELRLRQGSDFSNVTVMHGVSSLTLDTKLNDVGSINFTVRKAYASGIGLVKGSIIEAVPAGNLNLENTWYVIQSTDDTAATDDAQQIAFAGAGIAQMLNNSIVYPSTWPTVPTQNPDGTVATVIQGHSFENATAGKILLDLIDRAKTRGGLAWLDTSSFTRTTDSHGNAWGISWTNTFDNGTGYLDVVQALANNGMIDYWFVGNSLHVATPSTTFTTYTPEQRTFRVGQNVIEQSRTVDATDETTVVLAIGDDGAVLESADNPALDAEVGRRKERMFTASGISDKPTLQMLANANRDLTGHPMTEVTIGVVDFQYTPWASYRPGDSIWIDIDGGLQVFTVKQLALAQTDNDSMTVGLTVGDRISDKDVKNQRLIDNTLGTNGYGPIQVRQDNKPPANPTSVAASAAAYRDSNGKDYSRATVTWTSPTTNSDGTRLRDLDHFKYRHRVDAGNWVGPVSIPADTTPLVAHTPSLPVGHNYEAQICAVDTQGNSSGWVSSGTILLGKVLTLPVKPSTPSVSGSTLKSVSIVWDGKDNTGALVDISTSYAQVHLSTSSTFTPSASTQVGTLSAAGSVTVSGLSSTATYYAKVVIIDQSGNVSPTSDVSATGAQPPQVTVTDVNLTARDIGGITIFTQSTTPTGALVNDQWIDTGNNNAIKVYDGTTWNPYLLGNNALGTNISGDKISANSLDASKIVSGSITTSQLSAGNIDGSVITANSLDANRIKASTITANLLLSGSIKTSTSGARIEMDINGIRLYNTAGSAVVTLNSSTGNATFTGTITSGSSITGASFNTTQSTGDQHIEIINGASRDTISWIGSTAGYSWASLNNPVTPYSNTFPTTGTYTVANASVNMSNLGKLIITGPLAQGSGVPSGTFAPSITMDPMAIVTIHSGITIHNGDFEIWSPAHVYQHFAINNETSEISIGPTVGTTTIFGSAVQFQGVAAVDFAGGGINCESDCIVGGNLHGSGRALQVTGGIAVNGGATFDNGALHTISGSGSTVFDTAVNCNNGLTVPGNIILGNLLVAQSGSTGVGIQGVNCVNYYHGIAGTAFYFNAHNVKTDFYFVSAQTTGKLVVSNSEGAGYGANQANGWATVYVGNSVVGNFGGAGNYTATSTKRIKRNIGKHEVSSALVDSLRMVRYQLKEELTKELPEPDRYYFGVVAEELAEHDELKNFVEYDVADSKGPVGVHYDRLALATALSVNEKLNAKVDELTKRLEALERACAK